MSYRQQENKKKGISDLPGKAARCIQLDLDCADICHMTARMLARNSDFAESVCQQCAEACFECAELCRKAADSRATV